jgi:hypothetical protein
MRRWIVLCALAAGIAGCGGAAQPVTTTVVQTVTSSPTTPSSSTTTSSTSAQPHQSYRSYSAPDYTLDVPAGWTTVEDQTAKTGYVESKWQDPERSNTLVLVDSQPDTGLSAAQDAASVRAQTSSTPGYQEISFEPASIAGNDGWKWVFELPGSERVDYFLNVCGISFAVLGATAPQRLDQLAGTFQHVAESVQPSCSITTSTTAPTFSCPTESGVTRENDCPPPDPANPPADFCTTHQCIDSFYNGRGNAVQCNDGEWSMSGGIQGTCSYHGGDSSNPPGPPPNY